MKDTQMANESKILPCDCTNRTQDKRYGKGKRKHYRCKDGWRCSSCKTVKPIQSRVRRKKEVVEG